MGILAPTKRCCKCRRRKPLSEFHRNAASPDGHATQCKACKRKYYEANRERLIARASEWQKANPERAREHTRKHQSANPKPYVYQAPNDHRRAKGREYSRAYYEQNPEVHRAKRHARRARIHAAEGAFTPAQWRALCAHYGYRCLCCGKAQPEIKLTPDHVNPLARGGSNAIDNIQPLCLECNLRKGTKATDYRVGA